MGLWQRRPRQVFLALSAFAFQPALSTRLLQQQKRSTFAYCPAAHVVLSRKAAAASTHNSSSMTKTITTRRRRTTQSFGGISTTRRDVPITKAKPKKKASPLKASSRATSKKASLKADLQQQQQQQQPWYRIFKDDPQYDAYMANCGTKLGQFAPQHIIYSRIISFCLQHVKDM